MRNNLVLSVMLMVALVGCQSAVEKAVRNTKYSAWEVVGVEKRDLFKKSVSQTKDSQEEAQESFQTALEKLKAAYNFDGGDLENKYESLNSSYESAKKRSEEVHESVKKVNTIAGDLFSEWESEIKQIETASLKAESQKSLQRSKTSYATLERSLKNTEKKLDPVLRKFHDQVLFLKHNLNAKAITSLKQEHGRIANDVQGLIKEMNTSIAAANTVIQNLENE